MINQKMQQKTRNIKYLLKQIALKLDIDCFLLYVFFKFNCQGKIIFKRSDIKTKREVYGLKEKKY